MTLQETYEQKIPAEWKLHRREPHLRGDVPYRTAPMQQPPRRQGKFVGSTKPPRHGTLRWHVTKLLQAAPDGLTVPEIRRSVNVTANALSSLLGTMAADYQLVERTNFRVVGHKNCQVYKWIFK